jgi:3-hydroxymyristoyl/3-hydroxydecanoyl-(acyl carrier protein) dehydratase
MSLDGDGVHKNFRQLKPFPPPKQAKLILCISSRAAAAQLAGVVAQSDPQIPPLAGLKLTALRNVKIFGTARPVQTIRLEAKITRRLGNLVQAQATARVAGAVVLTAELTLSGS